MISFSGMLYVVMTMRGTSCILISCMNVHGWLHILRLQDHEFNIKVEQGKPINFEIPATLGYMILLYI